MRWNPPLLGWLVVCSWTTAVVPSACAADWPAYGGDAARSQRTAETVATPLMKVWTYLPSRRPQPAWPEPGRELHRMDFDYAFQPVLAGGRVFFGSSADDTLYALDAADGRPLWHFTASGPFRFAPAVSNGCVYAACDDGRLYCLRAADGSLAWTFRAAPAADQLLGNGRMISRWPLRAGVALAAGRAYVAAGMWPGEGIYLYALDAATGAVIWKNDTCGDTYMAQPHPGASAFTGVAPQGYLAVCGDTLLVPTGRSLPAAFDLLTGALKYYAPASLGSDGGAWLATGAGLFLNPKNGGGGDSDASDGSALDPSVGDGMNACDLATGKRLFALERQLRGVVAGATLYTGGATEIVAYDLDGLKQGKDPGACLRWSVPHERTYALVLAGETVLAGGRGVLTALRASDGQTLWSDRVDGQVRGLAVGGGLVIAATERGGLIGYENLLIAVPPKTVRITPSWRMEAIGGEAERAAAILSATGRRQGQALVVGESDSRLAAALVLQSELSVIGLLNDPARLVPAREELLTTGLYGQRIVLQAAAPESAGTRRLPFAPYFADLVVVEGDVAGLSGRDLFRVVRPCGGVWVLSGLPAAARARLLAEAGVAAGDVKTDDTLAWVERGAIPGAADWRYQWADGGRSGVGRDTQVKLPLELLWFGGPGPARMVNRHWGTSTPLCTGGRLFVTGQNTVIALDAYTGRGLWTRDLPNVGRVDATWRASNMVADDRSLFATLGPACFEIDQASGQILTLLNLPPSAAAETAPLPAAPAPPSVEAVWPTQWTVFGPAPKTAKLLEGEALRTIPAQLTIGERTYTGRELASVGGMLDLTYAFGGFGFQPLPAGQQPDRVRSGGLSADMNVERQIAYAFARISCAESGVLRIGASADWWMQWFVDGKPVYSTLANGNNNDQRIDAHVFTTNVTAGGHVLAVLVRAGSRGWSMMSAGGRAYDRFLAPRPAAAADGGMEWGYLSVVGDMLLASATPPARFEAGQDGKDLFALNKQDGGVRWRYAARRRIPSAAIAFGDGRVFLLDSTSQAEKDAAKRRGQAFTNAADLVALDLVTGRELWRRDGIPEPKGDVPHFVQYSQGIVEANAAAAFEADSGKPLWIHAIACGHVPLIRAGWLIAPPVAYDLRTGEPVKTPDLLTGQPEPWSFARSYGCGDIAGCDGMLFFRSGTFGFYDFAQTGTGTFGGARPNCSVSMVAADGLMLLPEASAGCSCSYNFQTSLALAPAARGTAEWIVFSGIESPSALRQLRVNFGAPGDRTDREGRAWFAFPRPAMGGARPVPLSLQLDGVRTVYEPSEGRGTAAEDAWLYDSSIQGWGRLTVGVDVPAVVAAPPCATAPRIDGRFDDEAWTQAPVAVVRAKRASRQPEPRLAFCRDAANLYVRYERRADRGTDGKPLAVAGTHTNADDQALMEDDSFEILIAGKPAATCLTFGLSCTGARVEGKGNPFGQSDVAWNGVWRSATQRSAEGWDAEVAIPFETLSQAGIVATNVHLNVRCRLAGEKAEEAALLAPQLAGFGRCAAYLALSDQVPEPIRERAYTVRLRLRSDRPTRVAVALQETPAPDAIALPGGPGETGCVAREFKGVRAGQELRIDLDPADAGAPPPQVCGLEVLAEEASR